MAWPAAEIVDNRLIALTIRCSKLTGEDIGCGLVATGTNQRLTNSDRDQTPTSWSPDGKDLAFVQRPPQGIALTNGDIWTLSDAGGLARPFLGTPAYKQYSEFSPDGRRSRYAHGQTVRAAPPQVLVDVEAVLRAALKRTLLDPAYAGIFATDAGIRAKFPL